MGGLCQLPPLNVTGRVDRWVWDPEEERKRQERWQREQERLLQVHEAHVGPAATSPPRGTSGLTRQPHASAGELHKGSGHSLPRFTMLLT